MVRCYPTTCQDKGCDHEAWVDEPGGAPRQPAGAPITCDCGAEALIKVVAPPTVGIIVEHYDPQTGETFKSNAHYKDYLNYGKPIKNASGEVTGFKKIREYSSAELDQHRDKAIARMEATAAKNGMTLEQAAAKRRADVVEKRTKEIEAGQKPTVAAPKEFRL